MEQIVQLIVVVDGTVSVTDGGGSLSICYMRLAHMFEVFKGTGALLNCVLTSGPVSGA